VNRRDVEHRENDERQQRRYSNGYGLRRPPDRHQDSDRRRAPCSIAESLGRTPQQHGDRKQRAEKQADPLMPGPPFVLFIVGQAVHLSVDSPEQGAKAYRVRR
jgi:hypothetical protein